MEYPIPHGGFSAKAPAVLLICLTLLCLLVLASPAADARKSSCDRLESQQAGKFEQRFARCQGDDKCEFRARIQCVSKLNKASCDTSACNPPGDTNASICVYQTAEEVLPKIDSVLTSPLTPALNAAWGPLARSSEVALDPLEEVYNDYVSLPQETWGELGCEEYCIPQGQYCVDVRAYAHVTDLTGLSDLVFSDLAVNSLTTEDLSAFSNGGPYAGRINAGSVPADGTTWNKQGIAIVLPIADPKAAITMDLGEVFDFCPGPGGCQPATFQASGNATYRVEYSVEGSEWHTLFDVPVGSGCSCLETRQISGIPDVAGRYLRIYATGGAGEYSVSSLRVPGTAPDGSVGFANLYKPASGPQSLIVSSHRAPTGSKWNDPRVTVLPNKGAASALIVDLGKVVAAGGPPALWLSSGDDHYVVEHSLNGVTWTSWFLIAPVDTSTSNIASEGITPPAVEALRYVRIYANDDQGKSSDGHYSVAGITFPVSLSGKPLQYSDPIDALLPAVAMAPESLITNTEMPEDGTAWDDSRYAYVLPDVLDNDNPVGISNALVVDLGKARGRGIDRVKIQASANDTYQMDISDDARSWRPLWVAFPTSSSKDHLSTRDSAENGQLLSDPLTNEPYVGRYVRVYASAGDTKHSISELQVFNNVLQRGCPFDSDANDGYLGNASCGFSGEAGGSAGIPSCPPGGPADCLKTKVKAHLTYVCESDIDSEKKYTDLPSFDVECSAGSPSGQAKADFCALSCGQPEDPNDPAFVTFMEIDTLKLSVDNLDCKSDGDQVWGVNGGINYFKDDITKALEKPIKDALNSLLNDNTPSPPKPICQ